MGAPKPAAQTEESHPTESDTNPIPVFEGAQTMSDPIDPPMTPVFPATGQSPGQEASVDEVSGIDVYSQRQQDTGSQPVHGDGSLVPGAAPKAPGPPRSFPDAQPDAVMIKVPLPIRERLNPHVPPPRIQVLIPKLVYSVHPKLVPGIPPHLIGVPFPQPMVHPTGIPPVPVPSQDPSNQNVLPGGQFRPEFRTIPVPLRGPPPQHPQCQLAKGRMGPSSCSF